MFSSVLLNVLVLVGVAVPRRHSWARNINITNVAPQKQNAIRKTRAQYAIALLNYLKRIAPQQLIQRTQVFTKKF
jgi:hypothetical protein